MGRRLRLPAGRRPPMPGLPIRPPWPGPCCSSTAATAGWRPRKPRIAVTGSPNGLPAMAFLPNGNRLHRRTDIVVRLGLLGLVLRQLLLGQRDHAADHVTADGTVDAGRHVTQVAGVVGDAQLLGHLELEALQPRPGLRYQMRVTLLSLSQYYVTSFACYRARRGDAVR